MTDGPEAAPAYGLWGIAILNIAVFLAFAFSFYTPRSARDWRTFGAFSAFIVALFVEMYGFPLSIFALSGWLAARYPGVDFLTHNGGHFWHTVFGLRGDPHLDVFHIVSNVLIFGGFVVLSLAWQVLWDAQRRRRLAVAGPYRFVRHPQYAAFIAIMLGFLLQWPTLPTLVMFPILVVMYVRLARKEEADTRAAFGAEYDRWAAVTPRFVPRLRGLRHTA